MTNAVARRRPCCSDSPTDAVQIPVRGKQNAAHGHASPPGADSQRRRAAGRRAWQAHSPDAIPPSVAALLAVTNIPPMSRRESSKTRQARHAKITVDSIAPRSQVSEKDLSQELCLSSAGRSPMDVLLSPPELLDEEDASVTSDSGFNSVLSTRVGSCDSIPSLGESIDTGGAMPSLDSPPTSRRRRSRPPRRSFEPVSSPSGSEQADHPLSLEATAEPDQLPFKVFDPSPVPLAGKQATVLMPLKSGFKSNLTASLKALRSAAKTLSTFTASSIPADDLLTRSILTIDPTVPFTDERRPPVSEEEPSEALRRYLNPTTSVHLDARSASPISSYTASIQMQTYKISRSRSAPQAGRRGSSPNASCEKHQADWSVAPAPRQREIRENPDFIRIAVMEHLMRKRGKLDESREGHARWLLPPRKTGTTPYEIRNDGTPARWVSIAQDIE